MPTELEVKIAVAIHALGLVRWNGARHLTVTNQFVAASVLQNHLAVITRGVTARMLLRPKHNRHTKHTRRKQEEPQHKRGTKQHKIEHQEFQGRAILLLRPSSSNNAQQQTGISLMLQWKEG
jgi:hypothetical protein